MFENNGNVFDNSIFNSVNDTTDLNNEQIVSNNASFSTHNDMPPELGEIKGLNDATKVNAPTLDVLAPMNVMPETVTEPEDALTQYENGLPNVFEIPSFNNNPIDTNEMQKEEQFPMFFNSNDESTQIELPKESGVSLINIGLENDNNLLKNENELSFLPPIEEEFVKDELEVETPVIENELTEDIKDPILNEDLEISEDEIMNEEEEIQKEELSPVEDTKDELISDKILKIRKYIDSLNLNVRIEEYDFEELYQLIIKIKK